MDNEIWTNRIVKESITEALLKLMKQKEYSSISITELVKVAGVSRMSFYRNYKSKDEILILYMKDLSVHVWNKQELHNTQDILLATFKIFDTLKPIGSLLHKSNLEYVFYDFLKLLLSPEDASDRKTAYYHSALIGILFGIYDQWIKHDMLETPEELVELTKDLFPDIN